MSSEPLTITSNLGVEFSENSRRALVPHQCLRCGGALFFTPALVDCPTCGAQWPVRDGVPFYGEAAYFGEVSQSEMKSLIELTAQTDWRTAIRMQFKDANPELYRYIADLNRASWIPLLPISPDSTVLDVGSGLGALTHTLALNYARVVSIEPVEERVRFTRLRIEQEGLTNVDLIRTTVDALPFSKPTFDLIVLNGILEWVGVWRREGDPRRVQLEVLATLRRILKPDGVLLVGIENRIGFDFFLGRVDHSGLPFTSLMPRWLASLYLRLKQPGFHRMWMSPSRGYRTYTYSPRGYRKLLGQAGFESIDVWWPLHGYNLPHVMYRVAARHEISQTALYECNAANRLNGYDFRRVLKERFLARTGLLYHTLPDLVMLARAGTNGQGRPPDSNTSLIEALQKAGAERSGATAGGHPACQPSVLMGHKLRNKSIIKLAAPSGAATAISKVANLNLSGADAIEHGYTLLQRLHALFQAGGAAVRGSIPSPVTLLRHGSLVASVEAPAPGVSLGHTSLEPRYLENRPRVLRHLDVVAAWVIEAQPRLALLQSGWPSPGIPLEWRQIAESRGQAAVLESDHVSWVQHGDFFPTNVLLEEKSGRLCVIDWDHCNSGYPPLFDWFCFITGLYYTHERLKRLPKGETIDPVSFRQTFFEPSWFADSVVALTLRISNVLELDRSRIMHYFREYLAVRHHHFDHDRESSSKERWGRCFKEFHTFFLLNQEHCIFHPLRMQ